MLSEPPKKGPENWCRAKIAEKCRKDFWHFLTFFDVAPFRWPLLRSADACFKGQFRRVLKNNLGKYKNNFRGANKNSLIKDFLRVLQTCHPDRFLAPRTPACVATQARPFTEVSGPSTPKIAKESQKESLILPKGSKGHAKTLRIVNHYGDSKSLWS